MSEIIEVPRQLAKMIRKAERRGGWVVIYCAHCKDNFNIASIADLEHHLKAEHGVEVEDRPMEEFIRIPVESEAEGAKAPPQRGPLPTFIGSEAPPKEAEIYYEKGLVVFPVKKGEKAPPLVDSWQNKSRDELYNEFVKHNGDCNIAIRLDGLCVLDLERWELYDLFFPSGPIEELAKHTWVAETGKGYHIYFRADNIKPIKADGLAELRTGPSQYCLAPPSLHPEGRRYKWLSDIKAVDIPLINDDKLEVLKMKVETLNQYKALIMKLAEVWKEYHRHKLALWLAGAFKKCKIPEKKAEVVIKAIALLAHDGEVNDRVRALADTYAKPLDKIKAFSGLREELYGIVGEAAAEEILSHLPRPQEREYDEEGEEGKHRPTLLSTPLELGGILYEPLEGGLILKIDGSTVTIGESLDGFAVDPNLLKALILPPQPIEAEPRKLWDGVRNYIKHYVYLTDECLYDVLTGFVFWSYFWDQNKWTPYLFIYGPYGSGKTRVLEVLRLLCYRAVLSSILRGPSLFRAIEKFYPATLLIDEARVMDDDVGDVLRTGYREGAVVIRAEPSEGGVELQSFGTYCLKIFAHRDEPSEDIRQRSIIVRMMRALGGVGKRLDEDEARRLRAGLYNLRLKYRIEVKGEEYTSICGDSRMEEIASPLIAVARAFNPEAEKPLIDYFKALEKERMVELGASDEAVVLEALLQFYEENPDRDYVTVSELKKKLESSWEKRQPGRVLKRLGFKQVRIGQKREKAYAIDLERLHELAARYFIAGEAVEEVVK